MTFIAGILIGIEICLWSILLAIVLHEAFKRRTSARKFVPSPWVNRDAKSRSVPKALQRKVVKEGKVISLFGAYK